MVEAQSMSDYLLVAYYGLFEITVGQMLVIRMGDEDASWSIEISVMLSV